MERLDQVIYENSRGQTILLEGASVPWREVMGREGVGVPPVSYAETAYANGVTEIHSVRMDGRDVELKFWMEGCDVVERRDIYHRLKLGLLEVGQKNTWGKLRFRCSDGRWVFLNCVYSGGLDSEADTDARFRNFILDFHSADPLFYAEHATIAQLNTSTGLGLRMKFRFGSATRLRSSRAAIYSHLIQLNAYTAYPEIEMVGPAGGIRFENETTGRFIGFSESFALAAGEKLRISTRPLYEYIKKIDTHGKETDVANLLSPGATLRWPLVNGDNSITLQMTGVKTETSCVFRYREGHLSLW